MTKEILSRHLEYCQEDGYFRRVGKNYGNKAGNIAGTVVYSDSKGSGYRRIMVEQKMYLAHRLAWLWVNGSFPDGQIDHINGDKDDNRIENLRSVTQVENNKNMKKSRRNNSGVVGVFKDNRRGGWIASITSNNKTTRKSFKDRDEAIAWRAEQERLLGFTERHGK